MPGTPRSGCHVANTSRHSIPTICGTRRISQAQIAMLESDKSIDVVYADALVSLAMFRRRTHEVMELVLPPG